MFSNIDAAHLNYGIDYYRQFYEEANPTALRTEDYLLGLMTLNPNPNFYNYNDLLILATGAEYPIGLSSFQSVCDYNNEKIKTVWDDLTIIATDNDVGPFKYLKIYKRIQANLVFYHVGIWVFKLANPYTIKHNEILELKNLSVDIV